MANYKNADCCIQYGYYKSCHIINEMLSNKDENLIIYSIFHQDIRCLDKNQFACFCSTMCIFILNFLFPHINCLMPFTKLHFHPIQQWFLTFTNMPNPHAVFQAFVKPIFAQYNRK